MRAAISDEPALTTVSACLDELKKCIQWERSHQTDGDRESSASQNARLIQAVSGYWRERRMRVEARFEELNDLSRS